MKGLIAMPGEAGIHQKLKLLYLAEIFKNETDEGHALSVYEISDKLGAAGISATRKVLLDDIALLRDFGMDIISCRAGRMFRYYLGARDFEITEIKLLADAVSSAKFITEKKSRELLGKLGKLAGRYSGQEINRRVYVANRIKSDNEMIYINIDAISQAIEKKRKISFKYFDRTLNRERKYREGVRVCSPYALAWSEENYYTVAFYEKYPESLSNFRVDKMDNVTVLDESAKEIPEDFDLAGYLNTTFSMFSAEECTVKLRFDEKFANAVTDRFGSDLILIPCDGGFVVNVSVKVSPAFFGWLFKFGSGAQIISPDNVRREFKDMLNGIGKAYEDV